MNTIFCTLLAIVLIHMYSLPATADNAPSVDDNWLMEEAAVFSANPEDAKQTITVIREATAFFNFMLSENMLPSTPAGTARRFRLLFERPVFAFNYPLKVVMHVELKNAVPEHQKYTLEKTAMNYPWKVISGLQMNAETDKVVDLDLPIQEDQLKANDKIHELQTLSMGDTSTKNIKLPVGESLILQSEQGKAIVTFKHFGNRTGGKSSYTWRYRASGEERESSGEGSVFENNAVRDTPASNSLRKNAAQQLKIQAGPIQIEWSYGIEDSFGWIYYNPHELTVTKTTTAFDAYVF